MIAQQSFVSLNNTPSAVAHKNQRSPSLGRPDLRFILITKNLLNIVLYVLLLSPRLRSRRTRPLMPKKIYKILVPYRKKLLHAAVIDLICLSINLTRLCEGSERRNVISVVYQCRRDVGEIYNKWPLNL